MNGWVSSTESDAVSRIPITPGKTSNRPKLVQVVRYGTSWAYPLYLDGSVTRVLPNGGVPNPVTSKELGQKQLDFDLKTA